MAGAPVQHVVIDDLLPRDVALEVARAFPGTEKMKRRFTLKELQVHVPALRTSETSVVRAVFVGLQSPEVLDVVSTITGIPRLQHDPTAYAGGVSTMLYRDFLNPHIDNSGHPSIQGFRRLNALYYVSPDGSTENGGNLELWSDDLTHRVEVPSLFNRLVIMATNRRSLHSVNAVKTRGSVRRCLSNYYYNDESPDGKEYSHVTSFRGRPGQPLADLLFRAEAKAGTAIRRMFPRNVNRS